MNTMERRVHPNCVYKSNPYHECIEACFEKMPQGNPHPPKKKSGSLILVVPKRLSFRKNKESDSSDTITMQPPPTNLKSSSVDSPSSSPVQFSFSKVESWNCDVTPLNTPQLQYPSFLPEEPSPKKQHSGTGEVISSKKQEEEECLKEFDSMRSTLTVVTDQSTEESDASPDSRVAIGNYFVKESVSSILPSILSKYGDIAESCKLESSALRSYYLECVCFIILELQSSSWPVIQLSETRIKEMLSIVKDAGSVGIDVGWLSPVVDRMGKVMELIKQRKAFQAEKREFESNVVECVRKELQVQLQVLEEKEEAASIARGRAEEIQGGYREMEQECLDLRERVMVIESKLVEIERGDYKSMVTQLL